MSSVISIKDLVKTYTLGDAAVRALAGVSLEVDRGAFVAVTGPSGSGKSTLMHILGCLDRPTSGQYVLDGRDVSKMSRDELAEATVGNSVLPWICAPLRTVERWRERRTRRV
jgi:putative ABC transport system ATP-binding protein